MSLLSLGDVTLNSFHPVWSREMACRPILYCSELSTEEANSYCYWSPYLRFTVVNKQGWEIKSRAAWNTLSGNIHWSTVLYKLKGLLSCTDFCVDNKAKYALASSRHIMSVDLEILLYLHCTRRWNLKDHRLPRRYSSVSDMAILMQKLSITPLFFTMSFCIFTSL